MDNENKKEALLTRLKYKYRLVLLDDETFAERFAIHLTPLKVFVLWGTLTIVMVVFVTSLIAFTPLREYIPGYADVGVTRQLISIEKQSDSLQYAVALQNEYIKRLTTILNGGELENTIDDKLDADKTGEDSLEKGPNLNMSPSENETAHRKMIEDSQDKYSLQSDKREDQGGVSSFFFFTPVKGLVSNSFNTEEKHLGVDVVAPENEPIKATMDGTVILSNWTTETGHTIMIQHKNEIISVYKHNSVLLKKVGNSVKAGDPVAIIGNSGEKTTGPHLHFELWHNGYAIDPQDYVIF